MSSLEAARASEQIAAPKSGAGRIAKTTRRKSTRNTAQMLTAPASLGGQYGRTLERACADHTNPTTDASCAHPSHEALPDHLVAEGGSTAADEQQVERKR